MCARASTSCPSGTPLRLRVSCSEALGSGTSIAGILETVKVLGIVRSLIAGALPWGRVPVVARGGGASQLRDFPSEIAVTAGSSSGPGAASGPLARALEATLTALCARRRHRRTDLDLDAIPPGVLCRIKGDVRATDQRLHRLARRAMATPWLTLTGICRSANGHGSAATRVLTRSARPGHPESWCHRGRARTPRRRAGLPDRSPATRRESAPTPS